MGHFLNFGAGPNRLPEPWQNFDLQHDIRKRLKFEDGSASFILAEHVIEHVPFLQGFGFLQECNRLLEPGGVLRLAFPDVSRLLAWPMSHVPGETVQWNGRAMRYAQELAKRDGGQMIREVKKADEKLRAAGLLLLVGWQHQCTWTQATAAGSLLVAGFRDVSLAGYGVSVHHELFGVDGHHRDVGGAIAEMETSVVEATK